MCRTYLAVVHKKDCRECKLSSKIDRNQNAKRTFRFGSYAVLRKGVFPTAKTNILEIVQLLLKKKKKKRKKKSNNQRKHTHKKMPGVAPERAASRTCYHAIQDRTRPKQTLPPLPPAHLVEIQGDLAVDPYAEVVVHDQASVLLALPETPLARGDNGHRPPVQHRHLRHKTRHQAARLCVMCHVCHVCHVSRESCVSHVLCVSHVGHQCHVCHVCHMCHVYHMCHVRQMCVPRASCMSCVTCVPCVSCVSRVSRVSHVSHVSHVCHVCHTCHMCFGEVMIFN